MSSRSNEIEDPNLAGLPPEAFDPIEPGVAPTVEQLEARIRIKREAAMQDEGIMQSPHHAEDIEPLPPPSQDIEKVPDEADTEEQQEEGEAEEPEADEPDEDAPDDEPAAEESDEDFYVSRYKTKEDAEAAMREKDLTIARLFRERYEREQQQTPKPGEPGGQQEQAAQPQIDTEAWHEWAATAVDEGQGVEGAMAALERGGPQGYDVYVAHWLESEDPTERATALAFNNEVQRQFAAMHARAAVPPTPTQPQNGEIPDDPIIAQRVVAAKFPDFEDLMPEMDRLMTSDALDNETKNWLVGLAQQGGAGKARAWDYLYRTAKATRAPTPSPKAVKEERQRRKVSADEDKLAATVSSSEGSSTRTPRSEAELAVIRKKNGIRERLGQPLIPEE